MGGSSSRAAEETLQPSTPRILGLWDALWHYGSEEELREGLQQPDATGLLSSDAGAPLYEAQHLMDQASLEPNSYSYPSLFAMDEETGEYMPTPHYQNMLSMASSTSSGVCQSWKRLIATRHGPPKSVEAAPVEDVAPLTPTYIGFTVPSETSTCSSELKPPPSESSSISASTERSNGSPSKRTSTLTQALQAARIPSPTPAPQHAPTLSPFSTAQPSHPKRPGSDSSGSACVWAPECGTGETSTAVSTASSTAGITTACSQEAEHLKTPGDLTVRGAGLYAELMLRQKVMDIGTGGSRSSVRSGPLEARTTYAQPAFRSEPLNAYVIADDSDDSVDSSPIVSNLQSPSTSPTHSEPLHCARHALAGVRIPHPAAYAHHSHNTYNPHRIHAEQHTQQHTHGPSWASPFHSHATVAAAAMAPSRPSDDATHRQAQSASSRFRSGPSNEACTSSGLQWGGLHNALSARSQNKPIQAPRRSSMDTPAMEGREVSFRHWQAPARQNSRQQEWEQAQPSGFGGGVMSSWLSGSNCSETSPGLVPSCLAPAAQQASYGDLLQAGSGEGRMGHGSCGELEREQSLGQQGLWGPPHGSNNSTILA